MAGELIVEFRANVSAEDAEAVVKRAGAAVRRRMRADDPKTVVLLVRVDGDPEPVRAALEGSRLVSRAETNDGSFHAL